MVETLFYNWNAILNDSKSHQEIISKIKNLTETKNPMNKKYIGKCFVLNAEKLLSLSNPNDEKVEVLHVAATRNYFNYWLNQYRGAYLDFVGINLTKLKLNKLLIIDEKNRLIYLRHEEK